MNEALVRKYAISRGASGVDAAVFPFRTSIPVILICAIFVLGFFSELRRSGCLDCLRVVYL